MIHVVWVETVYGWPEIYYTYKSGNNDWSTPARLEAGTQPDIAAGVDGTIDLVWLDNSALGGGFNAGFIRYRRWDRALQMWLDATNVAVGSPGTLQSPAVAVGPDGVSHVVWVDTVSGSPSLRYRRRSASGWSSPENVSLGTDPDIGVDPGGGLHMVWADSSILSDGNDIYYLWGDELEGWSLTYVMSDHPSVDSTNPTVAIDHNGMLHIAWRESAGNSEAILYRSGLRSSWPSGSEMVAPSMARVGAPAIAVDERRFVHLAFAGPEGLEHRVGEPTMQAWEAGEPIVARQPAATSPRLATAGDGTVYVVWTAPGVAGQTDIYYRAIEPGLEPAQTPMFTPTTVATTTPAVTLMPAATSTATSTPTTTAIVTSTPAAGPSQTATQTPEPARTATPGPSPTAGRTPSPGPTDLPLHNSYLPLILQKPARLRGHLILGPPLWLERLPRVTTWAKVRRFVFMLGLE
jgi:hypothetical protein